MVCKYVHLLYKCIVCCMCCAEDFLIKSFQLEYVLLYETSASVRSGSTLAAQFHAHSHHHRPYYYYSAV